MSLQTNGALTRPLRAGRPWTCASSLVLVRHCSPWSWLAGGFGGLALLLADHCQLGEDTPGWICGWG